jgi:hypothetical protein
MITLQTSILDVPGSYLSQDTSNPDQCLTCITSIPYTNAMKILQLNHNHYV